MKILSMTILLMVAFGAMAQLRMPPVVTDLKIWVSSEGVQGFRYSASFTDRDTEAELAAELALESLGFALAGVRWCLSGWTIVADESFQVDRAGPVVILIGACR